MCLDCTQHTLSEGWLTLLFPNGQNDICYTFVSLILEGGEGYMIRIFLFSLVRECQRCFLLSVNVIQPLKREGVHKDLLTDHQRDFSKPLILITFYLVPLQSRIARFL